MFFFWRIYDRINPASPAFPFYRAVYPPRWAIFSVGGRWWLLRETGETVLIEFCILGTVQQSRICILRVWQFCLKQIPVTTAVLSPQKHFVIKLNSTNTPKLHSGLSYWHFGWKYQLKPQKLKLKMFLNNCYSLERWPTFQIMISVLSFS